MLAMSTNCAECINETTRTAYKQYYSDVRFTTNPSAHALNLKKCSTRREYTTTYLRSKPSSTNHARPGNYKVRKFPLLNARTLVIGLKLIN